MKPKSYLLPEQRRDKSRSLGEIKVTCSIDRIDEMTIDEIKAVRSLFDVEVEKRIERDKLVELAFEAMKDDYATHLAISDLDIKLCAEAIVDAGWRPTEGK